MLPQEIIVRKRDGLDLSSDNITGFVQGYVEGEIPDYQMSAFLMAVYYKGMNPEETAALAKVMMNSGIIYDWSKLGISGVAVDKHSTGGVGDKVSLILAPLAAACGLIVPMVTGRGLGNTGGTTDKLESIPGFRMEVPSEEFIGWVKKSGVAIIGQEDNFVPADKKMYALRDVTGTVESIPLICSSILSKKVASGAKGLVMDVKTGSGAFMKNLDDARELARSLRGVGAEMGVNVRAVLTDMSQPLGRAVGNAIEVREAIECLKGGGPVDLREITIDLTTEMALVGNLFSDFDEAKRFVADKLDSGAAWNKFLEIITNQGGDVRSVEDPNGLKISEEIEDVIARESGYIASINCYEIGMAALVLGAGRTKVGEAIDHSVGLMMHKRVGDRVEKGDVLASVFHNRKRGLNDCIRKLECAFGISKDKVGSLPLIIEKI